jgi:hypothetical protein
MSMKRDASFIGTDSRSNFKQIIAKRSDLARFDGARMVPAGAGAVVTYPAGLVLGKVTSSGLLKAYNDANSDGSQVAVGILSEEVQTDEFGNDSEAVVLKAAVVYEDLLIGLDAAAKVDLKASSSVEHGSNLMSFNA